MVMDEKFIESVKKYPCLWNTSLSTYKYNDLKDAAWEKVLKETKLPDIKTAKNKWKKLRDSHRDALKRRNATRSGQGAKQIREWKFEKLMEFLIPNMTNRDRATNYSFQENMNEQETNSLETDETNEASETSSSNHTRSASEHHPPVQASPSQESSATSSACKSSNRKSDEISILLKQNQENRERIRQEKLEIKKILEKNNTLDETDTFFLSISKSVKKLSPHMQLQAKRKIFNVLLESEELELENTYTFTTDVNHWDSPGYTSAPGPSPTQTPGPSSTQPPGPSSLQSSGPSLEDLHMTDELMEEPFRQVEYTFVNL